MKTVYWMLRKITEENYMISTSKKNKNKETTNRVLPKLMVATCELKSSFHAANKILGILGYPKELQPLHKGRRSARRYSQGYLID